MKPKKENVVGSLKARVDKLAVAMEKMRLAEYIYMLEHPRRLMYVNFLIGIARGLGTAIGFTILGALVLLILQRVVTLNLPVISEFIATIVRLVEMNLGR